MLTLHIALLLSKTYTHTHTSTKQQLQQAEAEELRLEVDRLTEDNRQLCSEVQAVQCDLTQARREVAQAQLTLQLYQDQATDARCVCVCGFVDVDVLRGEKGGAT